jgi:hypothetical protein
VLISRGSGCRDVCSLHLFARLVYVRRRVRRATTFPTAPAFRAVATGSPRPRRSIAGTLAPRSVVSPPPSSAVWPRGARPTQRRYVPRSEPPARRAGQSNASTPPPAPVATSAAPSPSEFRSRRPVSLSTPARRLVVALRARPTATAQARAMSAAARSSRTDAAQPTLLSVIEQAIGRTWSA